MGSAPWELCSVSLWLGMCPCAAPHCACGMLLCSSAAHRCLGRKFPETGKDSAPTQENNEERERSVSSAKPGYPRQRQHKQCRDSPVPPCQGHPFCAQRVPLMDNRCWPTQHPDKPGMAPCNQLQPVCEELSGTPFPLRPSVFPDS